MYIYVLYVGMKIDMSASITCLSLFYQFVWLRGGDQEEGN